MKCTKGERDTIILSAILKVYNPDLVATLENAMPIWTPLPLDYDKYQKGTETFVTSATVFDANSLGKITPAKDTERQEHFVRLLKNIAWHLGSPDVPVFLSFNGDKRRMDKGCIGHA